MFLITYSTKNILLNAVWYLCIYALLYFYDYIFSVIYLCGNLNLSN